MLPARDPSGVNGGADRSSTSSPRIAPQYCRGTHVCARCELEVAHGPCVPTSSKGVGGCSGFMSSIGALAICPGGSTRSLGSRLTLCSRTPRKGTVGSELRNSNSRIPRRSLELRGPGCLGPNDHFSCCSLRRPALMIIGHATVRRVARLVRQFCPSFLLSELRIRGCWLGVVGPVRRWFAPSLPAGVLWWRAPAGANN